jgi:hypothetical protein
LAALGQQQARALEDLERQLSAFRDAEAPVTERFDGPRQLHELVLRLALRAQEAAFLAPASVLEATAAIWRRRSADARPSALWAIGTTPANFPVEIAGTLEPERIHAWFHEPPVLLVTETSAVVGVSDGTGERGAWTTDGTLVAVVRAALHAVVAA